MTIITYRAGVMACDSMWSDDCDNLDTLATKISRNSWGVLIGAAGDSDDRDVIKVLASLRTVNNLPSKEALGKIECDATHLVVFPRAERMFAITTTSKPQTARTGDDHYFGLHEITGEFHAIGSGYPFAIGAMEHGADAVAAVKIACRRNAWCRPPVHQLLLHPKPVKQRGA